MGKHTHTGIKTSTAVFSCYEKINKPCGKKGWDGGLQSASVKTPQLFIHVTVSLCQGRPLLGTAVERLTTKQEKLF